LNNNNRGNNRRRGRNNNGRQQGGGGGQQLNRIDSRARGNAPQLLEKYRKMAQDAHLNGDRVQAEYYLQFADHYFRVIADTRLRQEEQRARQNGGVAGDRWQEQEGGEDDGLDFSVEGDFPAFDRPQVRREEREPREPREQREPREHGEQRERFDRDNRRDRDDRGEREDNRDRNRNRNTGRDEGREDGNRGEGRNEGRNEGRGERRRRFEPQVATEEALPGEGVRADEGEPIADASDNPFVRDARPSRGLRPRGAGRQRRDAETGAEAPAAFDPSSLPPAIGVKAEAEVEAPAPAPATAAAEEAAPAPKKRGRPRKNPLPEAAPAGE
jgi:hypothetical protein